MSEQLSFTGERLHGENVLFGVDLVRHRAAYAYAIDQARSRGATRVMEIGSGTGYGTAELAEAGLDVFAVDRVTPDREARHPRVGFVRGDAAAIPVVPDAFDLVVSFQVIEHLEDPMPYVACIAHMTRPGGVAMITTPNLVQSDRENPFHLHEYTGDELKALLGRHFEEVEMLGVGATLEPMAYYDERLRRIRRIVRLDPLGLRKVLPRGIIDRLFAMFAVVVRRGIQQSDGLPDVTLDDFPIEPVHDRSLDLLAVCRRPRTEPAR